MTVRELANSIKEFQADSGYAIVQDPNTGAILAMASLPTFNPNDFNKVTDFSLFRNPIVSDMREPGSTMKVLTYASSIDAGAILSTTTFTDPGYVVKYGIALHNATGTNWGTESMLQGLGRSNNVAAIFAAEQLGQDNFYTYIKNFGIGKRTGIDLAGEVPGIVRWPDSDGFSPIDFYTTAFGQSAAVTPVQLVTAVSAVANGGTLLKPYVMKEITQNGKVLQQNDRTEIRQVVKPEAAQEVANMMAYGVEHGMVARLAAVPGYHVSVKTGTADVVSENGGYTGYTFASTMGFGPSHDPRFTLYIGLMHPRTSPWGENTASVSWGRLAKEILMYMKVQPTEPLPTPTATP
jgi:cell division protein FtsI/penicillin-binding protein 2